MCILAKQHGVRSGKYGLKTPGNSISETLNFKMSSAALALQTLVPLVQIPKPPTMHYQPADSPGSNPVLVRFLSDGKVLMFLFCSILVLGIFSETFCFFCVHSILPCITYKQLLMKVC